MRFLFPLGRGLFAFNFVLALPYHFTHEAVQVAAEQGVPLAAVLVPLSGVLALAGGISVAVGYKTRWGAWALAWIPIAALRLTACTNAGRFSQDLSPFSAS